MALTVTPNVSSLTQKNIASIIGGTGGADGGTAAGGGLIVRFGTIAFDASYPTGGEALAANLLNLGSVVWAWVAPTSGYVFEWDYANLKVIAYYSDNDAVADGALIQVPATTDLSALTLVPYLILGRA